MPKTADFADAVDAVAQHHKADVLVYTGLMERSACERVRDLSRKRSPAAENLILILSTVGGDPHAAYKIARRLGAVYKRFSILVPNICKSAGTLLCCGADDLIMTDDAELGPLDTQMLKRDEIDEFSSGLDVIKTLQFLEERAIDTFEKSVKQIKRRARGVSTTAAAEMAGSLTVGLYGKIFEQLDPVRLGEVNRAMAIAKDYGQRLAMRGKNFRVDPEIALEFMIMGYSSHGFVVDRREASVLFRHVREPSAIEETLIAALGKHVDGPSGDPEINWADELPGYVEADALRQAAAQAASAQPVAQQTPVAPSAVPTGTPSPTVASPPGGAVA